MKTNESDGAFLCAVAELWGRRTQYRFTEESWFFCKSPPSSSNVALTLLFVWPTHSPKGLFQAKAITAAMIAISISNRFMISKIARHAG